jgi:hypothetical protein
LNSLQTGVTPESEPVVAVLMRMAQEVLNGSAHSFCP